MKFICKDGRLFPSTNGSPIGDYVKPPLVTSDKMPIPDGYELVNGKWVNKWTIADAIMSADDEQTEQDKRELRAVDVTTVNRLSGDTKDNLLAKCINILKSIF